MPRAGRRPPGPTWQAVWAQILSVFWLPTPGDPCSPTHKLSGINALVGMLMAMYAIGDSDLVTGSVVPECA